MINLTVTDRFTDVALGHLTQLVEAADTICDPCGGGQRRHYTNGCYLWGHRVGSLETVDNGTSDTMGWDGDVYGTVIGMDACYGDFVYGVTAGYASQNGQLHGVDARSENDYFNMNLYASYECCGWFANGGAGFTYAWNHMHRRIHYGNIDRTADGSPDTPIASGFLYGGRRYILRGVPPDPMAGVRAATANVGDFTETGAAGLNLVGSSYYRNSARRGGRRPILWFIQPNLRLDLQGFYSYESADDVSFATARFPGFPRSRSPVPKSNVAADGSVPAITGDLGSRTSVYARYDGLIRDRYNVHGGLDRPVREVLA